MSQGLNKVQLIGNLGADPELRYTNSDQAVLTMRLAVSESWKDRDGQRKERVEWCTVVMWGKRGEALSRHLTKGQQVYVEGRLQTRKWQDKDGHDRWTTEIVASELLFLGGGRGGGQRGQHREERAPSGGEFPPDDFGDDQIPF